MCNVIKLANQLEKVMQARELYEKEADSYRALAKENGVTEEAINYILDHPAAGGKYE